MSDTGKQSPLGVNVLGTLLQNEGFYINPKVRDLAGESKYNDDYAPGEIVTNTCLKWLTYAINDAYKRGEASGNATPTVNSATYDAILAIGQSRIPALGNGNPPTYLAEDPSNQWNGEVTTSYGLPGDGDPNVPPYSLTPSDPDYEPPQYAGQGQDATWYPYTTENPNVSATQWGWLRLIALQAWNEFNYNGLTPGVDTPEYRYFLQSMLAYQGFCEYSNKAIFAINDSKDFLKGIYSNMDDLTSSDITGVSLANRAFGQDLINLGKGMELSYIATFGLPSNLLLTLKKNNAMTSKLSYALLLAGFTPADITSITGGTTATFAQEQSLYGAFLTIQGANLKEILVTLNCRTKGLDSLADLLSMKKLFPISYQSLTVPIYNTEPNPTNSKTYYLLFVNGQLNPQLIAPSVVEKLEPVIPPIPVTPPDEPIITPPPVFIDDIIVDIVEDVIPPTIPAAPPPETTQYPPPAPPTPPAPIDIPLPFVTGRDPAPGRQGGGGGCVALESFVPLVETEQKHNGREITKAWMLESGMKISLGTDSLEIVDGSVVKTLNDYQPCVRIVTSDGITLVCSTTAPILTRDKGFIPATEVYGKRVAVMRNGRTWYDEVVQLEDVGMKFVRVIDAGNNSFWAGERPGSFILHHNVPINDRFNYDKN